MARTIPPRPSNLGERLEVLLTATTSLHAQKLIIRVIRAATILLGSYGLAAADLTTVSDQIPLPAGSPIRMVNDRLGWTAGGTSLSSTVDGARTWRHMTADGPISPWWGVTEDGGAWA